MDPPFTRLDLLSCRNLLIYLTPELQKRIMRLFHYSLVPGGVLCLGSSESIGAMTDHFSPWPGKHRLFRRSDARMPIQAFDLPPGPRRRAPGRTEGAQDDRSPANLASLADQVLLQQFAPPAVLVNETGDILYVSGHTGKYLEPAAGKANWNLFAMAREGLRLELGSALHRAARQDEPVTAHDLRVGADGGTAMVTLTAQRVKAPGLLQGLIMVVFRDQPEPPPRKGAGGSPRIRQMQLELLQSREALHDLQQEMQTSQEELKSANEELQSTNEELQSTNEELTTSKEELQSLNEELQTINAEQQARMEELARTSSDMKNLLDSTDITTVFLDQELRVARFTSGASRLFQLLPGDVGRPLTDITSSLDYPGLPGDAREVLRTLAAKERSVTTRDGHWYSVRIMPYRSHDERIERPGVHLHRHHRGQGDGAGPAGHRRPAPGPAEPPDRRIRPCRSAIAGPAGAAVDGRLLQSNRAFRRMLAPGAAPATLLEALPELRPVLQAALARTPMSGEPSLFERPLRLGAASFELVTYRPAPDQFVCIFGDIKGSGGESGRLFGASGNRGGHADA